MADETSIEAEVQKGLDTIPHYPLGEGDAMKWAVAFRLVAARSGWALPAEVDDGLMVGWFANAMAMGETRPDPRMAELEAENAELRATLTATKGHATRARNEAAVLRAEKSPEARKVGRPVARFGKPGPAYSPELAAIAIGEMDNVEIVFSDGKAEIVALAPVTAWPQAWLPRGGRHMLREPVELEGGDAEAEVAGVALVSAGEQIGWCEFPEPVRLPKYGRVRLENCITF